MKKKPRKNLQQTNMMCCCLRLLVEKLYEADNNSRNEK